MRLDHLSEGGVIELHNITLLKVVVVASCNYASIVYLGNNFVFSSSLRSTKQREF